MAIKDRLYWVGMSLEPQLEKGMLEVIREIALVSYLKERPEILEGYQNELQLAVDDASKAFKVVLSSAGKKYKDLLFDLEDKMNHLASCEAEEKYIRGFIAGYRFLKKIEKSRGPLTLSNSHEGGSPK
ncbi:hypothetical protein [Paenibacillus popilliae]|uniref:Uncharacterized protein n=1 Tax=Paenibacillus popilliae ATCC 14706 TaxID=1212764 RepID=M9LJP2_PAEPP|nr:hypothetical protein [Paenibacillus popilliae]GAC43470.1 hypothetical protein PPOP_2853 [Paenibacillus popilliae ATCC 14706]